MIGREKKGILVVATTTSTPQDAATIVLTFVICCPTPSVITVENIFAFQKRPAVYDTDIIVLDNAQEGRPKS